MDKFQNLKYNDTKKWNALKVKYNDVKIQTESVIVDDLVGFVLDLDNNWIFLQTDLKYIIAW